MPKIVDQLLGLVVKKREVIPVIKSIPFVDMVDDLTERSGIEIRHELIRRSMHGLIAPLIERLMVPEGAHRTFETWFQDASIDHQLGHPINPLPTTLVEDRPMADFILRNPHYHAVFALANFYLQHEEALIPPTHVEVVVPSRLGDFPTQYVRMRKGEEVIEQVKALDVGGSRNLRRNARFPDREIRRLEELVYIGAKYDRRVEYQDDITIAAAHVVLGQGDYRRDRLPLRIYADTAIIAPHVYQSSSMDVQANVFASLEGSTLHGRRSYIRTSSAIFDGSVEQIDLSADTITMGVTGEITRSTLRGGTFIQNGGKVAGIVNLTDTYIQTGGILNAALFTRDIELGPNAEIGPDAVIYYTNLVLPEGGEQPIIHPKAKLHKIGSDEVDPQA